MNPATGLIGTLAADDSVPDGTTQDEDNGGHQKQYDHTGDVATVEMGAWMYVPLLGRFLSADPRSDREAVGSE